MPNPPVFFTARLPSPRVYPPLWQAVIVLSPKISGLHVNGLPSAGSARLPSPSPCCFHAYANHKLNHVRHIIFPCMQVNHGSRHATFLSLPFHLNHVMHISLHASQSHIKAGKFPFSLSSCFHTVRPIHGLYSIMVSRDNNHTMPKFHMFL